MFKKLFCKHDYKQYSFKREFVEYAFSVGPIYLETFICGKCGKKKEVGLSGVRRGLAIKILEAKEKRDEQKLKLNIDKEYDKYKNDVLLGADE